MGDLIVMTRPTGPSRRQPPIGVSADILFFTGVRYERVDDTVAAPTDVIRRRRAKPKGECATVTV